MSKQQQVQRVPGLELLLRLVAEQLETQRCQGCGATLANSRVALRAHDLQHAVIEVTCSTCSDSVLVRVEPQAREGTASVS